MVLRIHNSVLVLKHNTELHILKLESIYLDYVCDTVFISRLPYIHIQSLVLYKWNSRSRTTSSQSPVNVGIFLNICFLTWQCNIHRQMQLNKMNIMIY